MIKEISEKWEVKLVKKNSEYKTINKQAFRAVEEAGMWVRDSFFFSYKGRMYFLSKRERHGMKIPILVFINYSPVHSPVLSQSFPRPFFHLRFSFINPYSDHRISSLVTTFTHLFLVPEWERERERKEITFMW